MLVHTRLFKFDCDRIIIYSHSNAFPESTSAEQGVLCSMSQHVCFILIEISPNSHSTHTMYGIS